MTDGWSDWAMAMGDIPDGAEHWPERPFQTLSESLAELERTDADVARAASNYDAMVRRLTGNETRAEKRRRERKGRKP